MKKQIVKKASRILLSLLMVVSTVSSHLMFVHALGADDSIVWSFDANLVEGDQWDKEANKVFSTSHVTDKNTYLTNKLPITGTYSSKSLVVNGMMEKDYWELHFSTLGKDNLTLDADVRSSNTGAKNFEVLYKDGEEFKSTNFIYEVGSKNLGSITFVDQKTNVSYDAMPLPSYLLNQREVVLRLQIRDSVSLNGGTIASGGATNINNIVISQSESEPVPETKVAKPVADVPSGSEVASGSKVNFTTATMGATIVYNLVSADGDYQPLPAGGMTINTDTTIYVKAIKDGMEDSDVVIARYTVKTTEQEIMSIADARSQSAGSTVLIEGVVTFVSGQSITIQDRSAGIVVRLDKFDGSMQVGDILRVSGKMSSYNSLLQVANPTIVEHKKDGALPTPQIVTVANLLNNPTKYESERIKIVNAQLGNTSGYNTPLTQKDSTIQIYKLPNGTYPKGNVDVIATVGRFKDQVQLNITSPNDITENITGDAIVYADDLFISEYVEGKSYNKALELYNGTGEDIDLSHYTLKLYMQGSTDVKESLQLKGILENGRTYVLYNTDSRAAAEFKEAIAAIDEAHKSASSQITSFNGDDTIVLEKDGIIIDIFGKIGDKPVYDDGAWGKKAWANEDGSKITIDKTLVRNPLVTGGSTVFTLDEWDCYDVDTFKYLGNHLMTDGKITERAAAPVSDLIHNQAIIGQKVTFTSATEGAKIYYRIGNDTTEYLYKDPITITSLPLKITAYTKAEGYFNSDEVVFDITQCQVLSVKASPNGGAVKLNTKVSLKTETKDAKIYYAIGETSEDWKEYTGPIALTKLPQVIKAKASLEHYLDSEISVFSFTERQNENYNTYFGQLHSHTNYSDGAGTCRDAFEYASTQAENIDFLAVTDHSNSFDNGDSATIANGSMSEEWVEGHTLASQYTSHQFVGIYGYEMTWSNGLGHINTFNTAGFQSRTQKDYSTYGTALQNYYKTLKTATSSISQFNHPGTTFGDFSDFAYYDPEIDNLIHLVEVGNGEGLIGTNGYFPSYEYYTRALDKGWHVAPTNNQDNHKGKWGDANTGRSVILADSLSEEAIYDAMRNRRMYATEDNDLNIYYTLNDEIMGTILNDQPDRVSIDVLLSDLSDQALGKVQVIANGGIVVDSRTLTTNQDKVHFEMNNSYSYYYIKVIEEDGDIAVTAPVWTGEVEKAGISSLQTHAALTVQNQEHDVVLSLYNNESEDLNIESITFSINDQVIHTVDLEQAGLKTLKSLSAADYTFNYAYDGVGKVTIAAEVKATLNGIERVYNDNLYLTYVSPQMVTKVIIDGTHYNDYVTGYYGGRMGNFIDIAAKQNILVDVVTDKITDETLKDASLLIVSAPAKKSGTDNAGDYTVSHFEEDFIQTVKRYTDQGGTLITAGLADYQDREEGQSSTEINKLLTAIGATNRLNSDELMDDDNNGGQAYRLYFNKFNTQSAYMQGIQAGQEYSSYSGSSVLVGEKGQWLVKGHDTTYSIDSKQLDDNYHPINKGEAVALAFETLESGADVFVAGTVFMSDFEVQSEVDNVWDLPYANKTIIENVLDSVKTVLPTTSIEDVRKAENGEVFAVEGYVTAGTKEGNAFFDTIYIQDETGGINIFPINEGEYLLGDKVRVVGSVDEYQGDKELRVITVEKLDEQNCLIDPILVSSKDAMNYEKNGGLLVQVKGTITKIEITNGVVETIYVKGEDGVEARIFIDGYILYSDETSQKLEELHVGDTVTAVGLVSYDPLGVRLRVRDRSEIVYVGTDHPTNPDIPVNPDKPDNPDHSGDSNVDTSDTTDMRNDICIVFLSLAAVILLTKKRKCLK